MCALVAVLFVVALFFSGWVCVVLVVSHCLVFLFILRPLCFRCICFTIFVSHICVVSCVFILQTLFSFRVTSLWSCMIVCVLLLFCHVTLFKLAILRLVFRNYLSMHKMYNLICFVMHWFSVIGHSLGTTVRSFFRSVIVRSMCSCKGHGRGLSK